MMREVLLHCVAYAGWLFLVLWNPPLLCSHKVRCCHQLFGKADCQQNVLSRYTLLHPLPLEVPSAPNGRFLDPSRMAVVWRHTPSIFWSIHGATAACSAAIDSVCFKAPKMYGSRNFCTGTLQAGRWMGAHPPPAAPACCCCGQR